MNISNLTAFEYERKMTKVSNIITLVIKDHMSEYYECLESILLPTITGEFTHIITDAEHNNVIHKISVPNLIIKQIFNAKNENEQNDIAYKWYITHLHVIETNRRTSSINQAIVTLLGNNLTIEDINTLITISDYKSRASAISNLISK